VDGRVKPGHDEVKPFVAFSRPAHCSILRGKNGLAGRKSCN
jgi:hypothetical protein